MDLGETDPFFDGSEAFYKKVDKFLQDKCGKTLSIMDDPRDRFIPKELNDEDFMAFLDLCDLHAYKLTQFESDAAFLAIWLPEDDDYLKEFDECTAALVYEATVEDLKNEAGPLLECQWDGKIKIKGSLEEISHSPSLLQSLLGSEKSLKYDEAKKILSINPEKTKALFAVNEVLKKPLFEVRKLTLDEVKALEENLGMDEEW